MKRHQQKQHRKPRSRPARGGNAASHQSRAHAPLAARRAGPRGFDRRATVGQELTLEITELTLEGEAVARSGDYVLFVPGAIPGEQVVVHVVSAGPRYGRARVVELKHRSPFRVEPRCRHFGECGGCSWQHIDYAEQLRWKERLLQTALEHRLPGMHLPIRPIIGLPDPWSTRNKAQFLVCSDDRGRPALGYYRMHSRDPVAVVECPVHHATANRVARSLLKLLDESGVPPHVENDRGGCARHVMVRVASSSNEALAVLVASRPRFEGVHELGAKLLAAEPAVTGVHLNVNSRPGSVILGPDTRKLAGRDRLVEEIAGVRFLISPLAFFQTSSTAASRLVETVLRFVPPMTAGQVLDLYAGVGLFALPLARRGHRVVAVEENPHAVSDGIESAKLNEITGCRFQAGKVESSVKRLARADSFDVVLLDPPREGCPEWTLRMIARSVRPQRIIDVSCDPPALARDLAVLTRAGYRVREIQPIDMFPHTSHIESVALLDRTS